MKLHIVDARLFSQRKYVLDLLNETNMLGVKPTGSSMEQNVNLNGDDNLVFLDKRRYRSLVGKLICLTITRPDITFFVSTMGQFMGAPKQIHWEVVHRILRYLKGRVITWMG